MDISVAERISQLLKEREWTKYRLAEQSGLSYSTIANIFRRPECYPSIPTLSIICDAFGITLAEFFSPGHEAQPLSSDQREILKLYYMLNAEQRLALKNLIYTINP